MATAVFFHAHPDDESITTAGTMARMAADGHRVVLVTATRGELGEVPEGLLAEGETLADRRAVELSAACAALGVARHEFLGYRDSGMAGEYTNEDPECFWQANVEEAAARLVTILEEERADMLVAYDENGGYGHPDHIQVHRVGMRAGRMAGTGRVYMATMNRDYIMSLASKSQDFDMVMSDEERATLDTLGVTERRITTAVDVHAFLDRKRRAMEAHASQIAETSFFLAMPDEAFAAVWGTEWFIRTGTAPLPGHFEGSLVAVDASAGT
jgi:LmbE family N-acetylglucosaminyl deacetylase